MSCFGWIVALFSRRQAIDANLFDVELVPTEAGGMMWKRGSGTSIPVLALSGENLN